MKRCKPAPFAMKLQINTSGAWRNVCEFAAGRHREVKSAVEKIAPLVDADWCIVDDEGRREWIKGGRSLHRTQPGESV